MSIAAEPNLSDEQLLAVARSVTQFNRGLYFECHETLEEVWLPLRGPSRDFFQGLIQVSVGFLHLGRGNHAGARTTFSRALRRFEAYPDRYFGFDLAAERTRLQALLATEDNGDIAAPELSPCWTFEGLPAADRATQA